MKGYKVTLLEYNEGIGGETMAEVMGVEVVIEPCGEEE